MRSSKGANRLAFFPGGVFGVGWLTLSVLVRVQMCAGGGIFGRISCWWDSVPDGFTIVTLLFFVVPFLLVHGTAWVIRGFREDKAKSNRPEDS